MAEQTRAIFWDRDGTLIEDRGYLADPGEAVLIDGAVRALLRLKPYFVFFIVTNQAGIARGAISARDAARVNESLLSRLAGEDIHFAEVYVCPHSKEDNCKCRKPRPYFLEQAAKTYHVALDKSYVVGDHPSDIKLAANAGAKGVYVCTGHGQKHLHELEAGEIVVPDISAAADWILGREYESG